MNFKLFFFGFGFLLVGYLIYRWIRNDISALDHPLAKGLLPGTLFGLRWCIFMCVIAGIVFILRSLPTQI
jgi:hypothetical protein